MLKAHSGQWAVRCMSKDHLNLLVERLKNRYDAEVELGETRAPSKRLLYGM